MKTPPCYCDQSPRDEATGQRRFLCNVCVNAVVEEKNRLAHEALCLPERLAAEFERGRRYGLDQARELREGWEAARAKGVSP